MGKQNSAIRQFQTGSTGRAKAKSRTFSFTERQTGHQKSGTIIRCDEDQKGGICAKARALVASANNLGDAYETDEESASKKKRRKKK